MPKSTLPHIAFLAESPSLALTRGLITAAWIYHTLRNFQKSTLEFGNAGVLASRGRIKDLVRVATSTTGIRPRSVRQTLNAWLQQ